MADVAENLNTLNKEVFGEGGVPNLIPDSCKLQKAVKFSESEQMGLKFVQTVRLAYPGGVTYAKGDGTAGAFAYNDAIGGVQARAEVSGSQIHVRDLMSYEDAMKCTGSKRSFEKGSMFFYEGIQKVIRKKLEIDLWYGGQGIGGSTVSVNINATSTTVTISAAKWASGIWSGMEGHKVNFYSDAGALISSGADSVFTITSVDPILHKVVFTGTATGIAALDTAIAVALGCKIFWNGSNGNQMTGVHGILNNTGSLFGISASTYQLWSSTQYAPTTSGPLSYDKVKKAIGRAVGKGLDEDIDLYVSPGAWEDMSNNLASLVRYSGKDKAKYEIGAEQLEIYGQNGKVTVIPNIHTWEGFAYGICKSAIKRVGASDVTFSVPGFDKGQIFFNLPGYAAVEARGMCHQAVFSESPGKHFVISGIVNNG